jgi:DNA-binding beta-propeller fold protein YncE
VGGALSGTITILDIVSQTKIAEISVGKLPIQVVPSPDGRYLVVPNTGSADVTIIDAQKLEVVKTLPSAPGAHGAVFGPKEGGGQYAYVTNKFGAFVTVIDMDRLEVAGHIAMPAGGGNGIHLVPNPYR